MLTWAAGAATQSNLAPPIYSAAVGQVLITRAAGGLLPSEASLRFEPRSNVLMVLRDDGSPPLCVDANKPALSANVP